MNIPAIALEKLKCTRCPRYLSRGPVYIQQDSTALCGQCFTPDPNTIRNIHYEALAQHALFPCKYKDLGCEITVPFVQNGETIPHEEVCEYRKYVCPVLDSARCDWQGPRTDLLKHCEEKHSKFVLQNPCVLQHDITKSNEKKYIICALEFLFLLNVKISEVMDKLFYSVCYLGPLKEAKDFSYNLSVKYKNVTMFKECDVAFQGPQGCVTFQEAIKISEGIDKFTVEVKRKEHNKLRAKKRCFDDLSVLNESENLCAVCRAPNIVYHDTRGWLCESCAPFKRACVSCDYIDFDSKCKKHENFFCELSTRCFLCDLEIPRGSLSDHRSSACGEVYRVDSAKRMQRGFEMWFVVTAAGKAVCVAKFYDFRFMLSICAPVKSESLREFRCVVRIRQEETGLERTYTPEVVFGVCDWLIKVQSDEFPTWEEVLEVTVDITEI